ncbi:hypothetical protein BJF92_21820 [Rhizobium rhizosphaerae]|uniref:Prohead serine protease domain-containing protein n=1 Tax=Xaviernesmea rhizosphaerae TaxID=1672749 RepID=A0A1Q9AJ09_9HYPH|nr:HK97 family phage prohead protease [Xaviernesmea rhizosphaerae]OLP55228.1 hypothetical protein BJF92_21820 [Xaviernesmea rhizosphaerae]
MNVIRKFSPGGSVPAVANTAAFNDGKSRRVVLLCSTDDIDRTGDIVVQTGIDLQAYRQNPVILWQHDHGSPIARATDVRLSGNSLEAECEFPPAGVSALSDQIYALVRANVIAGVSIGFRPLESLPLDKGNPMKGPQRYTKSDLLEISLVSVPCNPAARVTWKYAEGDKKAKRKAEAEELRRIGEVQKLRLKQLHQI